MKMHLFVASLLFCVSYCPVCFGQVTPPEEYLGYKPGDDFHLATYEQLLGYFDLLARQSDRLRMVDMGPTTEGRRMRYAIISSEENMAKLDRYKEITRMLSLARGLSEEEAKRLSAEGKVVVWIDSGIHSTETSPPMHQFQLAYDLVTGSDPQIRFIRDNVILLLVHANPDGMTLVADWYMKHVGTPYEVSRPPVLYHRYAGHDNNRDFFTANLLETRNMNRVVGMEWYPELLYVQHETAPFPARIWIPPNPEPVNPNIHPIVTRWKNLIGSAMGQAFDAADRPGAMSRTAFDLWYPGYSDGPSVEGHNIPSILTETANYRYATPHFYRLNDFPEPYRDLVAGTFYPNPWEGGWWRFRDAIEYNLTASKAVMDAAAKYRYEFLYYKYKMGKDVVERFQDEPPYGWIISTDQRDLNSNVLMLNRFIGYGIEVYEADQAFVHEGISYPRGSTIIPTSQPFGLFVKNILEKQHYPDLRKYGYLWQGLSRTVRWDGAPLAPYDCVGWTLPVQMGIDAHEMSTPLEVKKTLISEAVSPAGTLQGSGSHYVFSHTDNNSFMAVNQILKAGGKVSCSLSDFVLGGKNYSKGTFVVNSRSVSRNALGKIASDTRITMVGGRVGVESEPIKWSRIALYKSWAANMDAGWISYILEKYGFTYHGLTDAEVRAGDLLNRFDVIVLPDQSASSIINGHRKGTMPPDYIGGITTDGVQNIKEFVERGGLLVCNKSSSHLPIEQFKLPIEDVLKNVKPDSFNCPGSLLKMTYESDHPLTFGLPEKGIAFFSRGLAFEMIQDTIKTEEKKENGSPQREKISPKVVAHYPDESLLISGWILGEDVIRGKAAILEVPFGRGRIILFGFNVHNRAQAYSTFKLLFNAVYLNH